MILCGEFSGIAEPALMVRDAIKGLVQSVLRISVQTRYSLRGYSHVADTFGVEDARSGRHPRGTCLAR